MALVFEYVKDLDTGAQPFISHEKDSTLYNYFIKDEKALDRSAFAKNGIYNDVTFANEDRHLTTKAVSQIGVKNFPGIGAIGFYKDAYSDDSRIVAPIHLDYVAYEAPTLDIAELVGNKLHVVITPPGSVNYNCYRIVARQGAFATEYITYKTDYMMDIPPVAGEYEVYCMGYDESNGTVSENSNELTLVVSTGIAGWAPQFEEVADLSQRLDNMTLSIRDIEGNVVLLSDAYEDLEDRVDANEDRLDGVDTSIDVIEDNVLLLTEKTDDHETRIQVLEQDLVDAVALADELNGEVI